MVRYLCHTSRKALHERRIWKILSKTRTPAQAKGSVLFLSSCLSFFVSFILEMLSASIRCVSSSGTKL